MASIRIRQGVFEFEASIGHDRRYLIVGRKANGMERASVFCDEAAFTAAEPSAETAARQWLGDMGLDGRQARRLLDAALRGVGPFADPKHPRRVA